MMIEGSKQQQLTFDKGITNVPSDAICSDNALAESVGMVYVDGEHKVIQKPVVYLTGLGASQTLIYIHKQNNAEHYIVRETNDIKWGTKSAQNAYAPAQVENEQHQKVDVVLFAASGYVQVTSIGNTLIFTDNNGLHYFKWGSGSYKNISFPIPNLWFEAKMETAEVPYVKYELGNADGMIVCDMPEQENFHIVSGKQEDFNNLVIGLYAKNKKEAAQSKLFVEPFFVRAALEMYDGTYTCITNPILLYPSVKENTKFYIYFDTIDPTGEPHYIKQILAVTQASILNIRQLQDFSDYSDIVKDVVIFASKSISLYNTTIDQDINEQPENYTLGDSISSRVFNDNLDASIYREAEYTPEELSERVLYDGSFKCLNNRNRVDINKDLEETSNFYKLASIGLKPIERFVNIGKYTTSSAVEYIETQESLKNDDYFSRNLLIPKITYAYNSRLNLANVSRDFFNGFTYFMPFDHEDSDTNEYLYTFDVTIRTDTGNVKVRVADEITRQKQGIYFYYPDSRATHVTIYRAIWGGEKKIILDADLKEHIGLHGAYYFAGFSPSTDEPTGTVIQNIPTIPAHEPELLYNQIIQSEVNNPWAFLAEGYHTVGSGRIIGLSTITQALSEGQFGAYPLLVFSENGIWGMSVDGKGVYSSIYPMSREICNSAASITQTDGAVFFTSKKGLMVVVGNQVKCVSEQLSGKTNVFKDGSNNSLVIDLGNFSDYLKNAFIAYDYRDSLLWIFNSSYTTCYIYSMKSGTFSKFTPTTKITNVVNNYPDYLLQAGTTIYSLTERKDINASAEQSNTYAAMLTRPLKLEDALALKSIMQVKHIHDMNENATLTLRIFASNNLNNWVELHSLGGMPWKYYRFRYDFSNLKATDRFAGTMLITHERRTNKLR